MNEQDSRDDGRLVPTGRRDLVPVAAANPLVSRGLVDLAKRKEVSEVAFSKHVQFDDLDRVLRLLDKLDECEASVLWMRYGLGDEEPKTCEEIGICLGMSGDLVEEIESEALMRLSELIECDIPVAEFNLSKRTCKCLDRLGINTLIDLTAYSADELLGLKDFGVTCLNEVLEVLYQFGLKLRRD